MTPHRTAVTHAALVMLLATAAPAQAVDGPSRKSGLWEMKLDGVKMAMQTCVDRAQDNALRAAASEPGKTNCTQRMLKRESATRLVAEYLCKDGAATTVSRLVITGDLDSNFVMEFSSRPEPAQAGQGERSGRMQGRWLGPCAAGMKPGDMRLPNGMVIPAGSMPGGGMPGAGMPGAGGLPRK